jgi:ribosomal protein S18 acetylase RimI-like enzyme
LKERLPPSILATADTGEAIMETSTVRSATPAEEAAAIATLTLAFATDPATRWTWPDPQAYLAAFPRFARAFGGAGFANGGAHVVGDHAGTALWLRPGVEPDGAALGELMRTTASLPSMTDGMQVMQQMADFHPREPHWYLPLIGIDPRHQGRGLGGALLSHALAICDREGTLAYLESSNPRNVPLYERHGFEVRGRIQHGSSPTLVPMLRRPQRRPRP